MRGSQSSMTAGDMLFGFNSTVAPLVNGGNFLGGNDFALSGNITPVFNDQIGSMADQQISFYPGTINANKVGIVRWQNGQNQINRKVQIFDGLNKTTVYKGLGDELAATSLSHVFNLTHTNGMQFSPLVENQNK